MNTLDLALIFFEYSKIIILSRTLLNCIREFDGSSTRRILLLQLSEMLLPASDREIRMTAEG